MNENRSDYDEKIALIKKKYVAQINEKMNTEEIINIGAKWYDEVNTINADYGMIYDASRPDNVNAYYIACDILQMISFKVFFPDKGEDNVEAAEEYKAMLSDEILKCAMDKRKTKILVFEPHHDDYMGSAATILYADSKNVQTIVYTISKSEDDRDSVDLTKLHKNPKLQFRKATSVINHVKCNLKDLHYDFRYEIVNEEKYSDATSYDDLIQYYTHCGYPVEKLSECIKKAFADFVDVEAKEKYVLLPLGILHPMHILTAYYGVIEACNAGFANNVLFYVEHPYDFQLKDTNRFEMAKAYYSNMLKCKYIRADGTRHNQKDVNDILYATYGKKHWGEFEDTLRKTMCSYLVPEGCLEKLQKDIPLHVNNVLYATFQAKPFFKTGGAGEVAYSYIKALSPFVNKIGVIMPKYKKLMKEFSTKYSIGTKYNGTYVKVHYSEQGDIEPLSEASECNDFEVELLDYGQGKFGFFIYLENTQQHYCRIEKYRWKGVVYYLLDINECFEDDNVLDNSEIERDCAAFSLAVMESLKNELDFVPTILHCNDNQTALIPFLHKMRYANYYTDLKTVYTIHFYGYKGIYSEKKVMNYLGINESSCDYCLVCRKDKDCLLHIINAYSWEDIDKLGIPNDKISFMKAGIVCADIVTTVSKGYAAMIQNYPDFKGVKVYGIRNGISMEYQKFSSDMPGINYCMQTNSNWEMAKKHNKAAFQKEAGLEINPEIPMFCMVSRLNATKGIEDIKNIFSHLMKLEMQLVIIGDDDKNAGSYTPYADFFTHKMDENRGRFFYHPYKEDLEFKAYSASDVLIMPSRDEACGTTQILAMKYGALPIVSMIDSFRDTVIDYNSVTEQYDGYVKKKEDDEDKGVGFFCFRDDCWVLLDIINMICKKLNSNEKEKKWRKAVNSTVDVDFSWYNNSVREYLELYDGVEIISG